MMLSVCFIVIMTNSLLMYVPLKKIFSKSVYDYYSFDEGKLIYMIFFLCSVAQCLMYQTERHSNIWIHLTDFNVKTEYLIGSVHTLGDLS